MLDIKVEIKSYIVREGTSLTKVMNALNKKKLITTTYSNIANKINTETITFNEAQYIFDHLGYKITIERKLSFNNIAFYVSLLYNNFG